MRVLHTIYDHPDNPWVGGGGAIRALELNRRLVERGHEVTVLSGNFPGATDGVSANMDFKFLGISSGYMLSTFSFAMKAAGYAHRNARQFDIIVEDFAPWNPALTYLINQTPSVLHVNHREGRNLLKRRPLMGWPFFLIEKFYPRMFNNVTALSVWTRKKINCPDALILPAGIGEDMVQEGTESSASNAEREDFLLFIGRLEINNKGLDTLMEAMGMLGDKKLIIVGKGRQEQRLREMARGLNVEFTGFVSEDEKRSLLARCGAFVLPSRFEGWGIAVLEAAAYGAPVVVSDIPELNYALEGGYGISFTAGDSTDLSHKILSLMDDAKARAAMSKRGLEAARLHTWGSVADIYEKYLEDIIIAQGKETHS